MKIGRCRKLAGYVVFALLINPAVVALLIEAGCRIVLASCEATLRWIWDQEGWLESFYTELDR